MVSVQDDVAQHDNNLLNIALWNDGTHKFCVASYYVRMVYKRGVLYYTLKRNGIGFIPCVLVKVNDMNF